MIPIFPAGATTASIVNVCRRVSNYTRVITVAEGPKPSSEPRALEFNPLAFNADLIAETYLRKTVAGKILVRSHSRFPLLASLENSADEDLWAHALVIGSREGVSHFLSFTRSTLFATQPRFCPECLAEDLNAIGVGFWRSQHEVAVVNHCAKHGQELVWSCGRCNPKKRDRWSIRLPGEARNACSCETYAAAMQSKRLPAYNSILGLISRACEANAPELRPCARTALAFQETDSIRRGYATKSGVVDALLNSWNVNSIDALGRRLHCKLTTDMVDKALFSFCQSGPEILQLVVINHYLNSREKRMGAISRQEHPSSLSLEDISELLHDTLGVRTISESQLDICARAVVLGFSIRGAWRIANGTPSKNVALSCGNSATARFVSSLPSDLVASCALNSTGTFRLPSPQMKYVQLLREHRVGVLELLVCGDKLSIAEIVSSDLGAWMRLYDKKWFDKEVRKRHRTIARSLSITPEKMRFEMRNLASVAHASGRTRTNFSKNQPRAYLWLMKNDLAWFNIALPSKAPPYGLKIWLKSRASLVAADKLGLTERASES